MTIHKGPEEDFPLPKRRRGDKDTKAHEVFF
jgi:hypothetical protein